MPITKSNKTRTRLMHLRDNLCLKWEEIAAMPEFNHPERIPQQTLYMIYSGQREVPRKFRVQLGEPAKVSVPVCPVHGVPHCFDCQTQTVKSKAEPKPPKQAARLPRYKSWLWDVPQKEIVAMLENRK